jgi:hypothetical protein
MLVLAENNDKTGLEVSMKEDYHKRKVFKMPVFGGVFNIVEHLISCGIVHEHRKKVMPIPTAVQWKDFLIALVFPVVPYACLMSKAYPKPESKRSNMGFILSFGAMFYGWIVLFACLPISVGFKGFAWTCFVLSGCILTHLRSSIRESLRIEGNMFTDLLYSCFLWSQVLCQLSLEYDGFDSHIDNDAIREQDV